MGYLAKINKTESDTLLSYRIHTMPDPLQAARPGKLTIVISNMSDADVYVKRLQFSFDIGDAQQPDAAYLTDDAAGIHCDVSPSDTWQIAFDSAGSRATITPKDGKPVLVRGEGITVDIYDIKVNPVVGTFLFHAAETSSSRAEGGYLPRAAAFQITKFPPGFEVGELGADPLRVPRGKATTLRWQGSPGEYVLRYDDVELAVTNVGTLKSGGPVKIENLKRPTTFYLYVEGQVDHQTHVRVRERTVSVLSAEITRFVAEPITLGKGQTCKLSWETNADSCELDVGTRKAIQCEPNGSMEVVVTRPTAYTLNAKKGDDTAQEQRQVNVVPPHIESFLANVEGPIAKGSPVTLSWSTQFCEKVTIEPGIGVVEASGSREVKVGDRNITYTLTGDGYAGPASHSLSFVVLGIHITAHLNVLVMSQPDLFRFPKAGVIQVDWEAENATKVRVSANCSLHVANTRYGYANSAVSSAPTGKCWFKCDDWFSQIPSFVIRFQFDAHWEERNLSESKHLDVGFASIARRPVHTAEILNILQNAT